MSTSSCKRGNCVFAHVCMYVYMYICIYVRVSFISSFSVLYTSASGHSSGLIRDSEMRSRGSKLDLQNPGTPGLRFIYIYIYIYIYTHRFSLYIHTYIHTYKFQARAVAHSHGIHLLTSQQLLITDYEVTIAPSLVSMDPVQVYTI